MADEITLSCSLEYADNEGANESLALADILATVATKKYTKGKQSVGTSEEALTLGEVTAPGWTIIINRDSTNFVNVKTGTGGTIFAKLKPGEFCLLRLGSGAQAPYAIADTAACQIEFFVISS